MLVPSLLCIAHHGLSLGEGKVACDYDTHAKPMGKVAQVRPQGRKRETLSTHCVILPLSSRAYSRGKTCQTVTFASIRKALWVLGQRTSAQKT